MLGAIKTVERNPYELVERPRTVLDRASEQAQLALRQRLEQVGPDGLFRDMFGLLSQISDKEWARMEGRLAARLEKERRRVARCAAGREVLVLIDAAHAAVRNGPLLALPNPREHAPATLVALGRVVAVEGSRGEERARLVLDAARLVSEQVYQPYLKAVSTLADVADGRAPKEPPAYGRLVQSLVQRLGSSYPSLVEHDAAHVRNAVVHGHATYVPRRHAVAMYDASGWHAELTVRELEIMTRRMLKVAGELYPKAVHAFMEEAFLRPLLPIWPEFSRAVVADDRAAMERTGAEVNRRADEMWADIARVYRVAATVA